MRKIIGLMFLAGIIFLTATTFNINLADAGKIASNVVEIVENKVCSHQWELLSEYDIEEGIKDQLLGNSYKMQVYECSKCDVKEVHKIPNIK